MRKIAVIICSLFAGCSIINKHDGALSTTDKYNNFNINAVMDKNLSSTDFFLERIEIVIEEEGQRQKLIGNVKYKKPGILLISLRNNTGIEGMRIYIDRDTILANDRINKKVYHGSSDQLSRMYGINMKYLPILIGDLVHEDIRGEQKEVKCGNGNAEIISSLEKRKIKYITDCKKNKVISTEFSREEGSDKDKIIMIFKTFKQLGNVYYPQYISITDLINNTQINIEIKRAEIYNGPDLKFVPGNNYEEVLLK